MGYTKEQIQEMVDEWLTPEKVLKLYSKGIINYRGKTTNTKEKYTEVIAAHLLENQGKLTQLPLIARWADAPLPTICNRDGEIVFNQEECAHTVRRGSYNVGHDGSTSRASDGRKWEQEEERIAIRLFNKKTLPPLGDIIDYQTPLADGRNSSIDLLSYDGNIIYIIELKRPDSKETLLRCILEAYTYSRIIDCAKLLTDFFLPDDTPICKAALVYESCRAHKDFKDENVKKLMKALGVDLFVFDKSCETIIEPHYFKDLEG